MGIPSYFSYIVKNHGSIIRRINALKDPVNNLYLDSNSIIYDVYRNIPVEGLSKLDYEIKIYEAISIQIKHGKYKSSDMYGDGTAGEKIANILVDCEPSIQKTIVY